MRCSPAMARHAAAIAGAELMGYEPEQLAGPLRNLVNRIKTRIAEKRASGFNLNFSNAGVGMTDSGSDSAGAVAPAAGSGLPPWAIPAAIAGVGVVAVLLMKGKK